MTDIKLVSLSKLEAVADELQNAIDTHTHTFANITDFPTSMPPTFHEHTISEITDLQTVLDGKAASDDLTIAITKITAIENKMPNQTSDTNQLADKDFVNSSINAMAAHQLTYNSAGDSFPTKASLTSAAVFYYNGQAFAPTEHDYCVVQADETQADGQVRYVFNGSQWIFSYKINDKPFTAAQSAAIDSGATKTIIDSVANKTDIGHTHTKANITDFPTTMTPAAHTHADANNGGVIAYENISGRPLFSLSNDGILTITI